MGTAIATLLDADALSGDFVSMAAGMGPEVWAAVVQVYAATLEAQGRQAPTWATSHSKKRSICKQQCREAVAAKDPEGPLRLAVTLTAHQAATLQTLMHTAWKAALCRGLQSVVSFHHEGYACSACVAADAHCLCAGEVHLAALHLLSTGDVHGAMQTYARAHLLGEAVALGSARLLPQDPFLQVSTAA